MKKSIAALLFLFLLGCAQDEKDHLPVPANGRTIVKEVVFNDFFSNTKTTMQFQYAQEKVQTIKWDFYESGFSHTYDEERFYSANGDLDSISGSRFNGGKWNLKYEYKNGLRDKIKSTRNSITTTTTFTEYDDTMPVRAENLYNVYGAYEAFAYANCTTFKFNAAGNLTSQQNTCIPGHIDVVEERTTIYGLELNPLRNLIETPLPQVFEFYDDLAFYFSAHLPVSVEANYPYVDPVHNRITFEYQKDINGRIIEVKALRPDNNSTRFTLSISYF